MIESTNELELNDRLSLIESMIAEGRRTTGVWGWMFVLWGVAYLAATAWATLGHSRSAWPVTMVLASVLSTFLARHQDNGQTATTLGRAVGAVWAASGISLFLVLFGLALAGRYETHVFLAVIGGILGSAHAASSMILRWKTQMFCALVWWAAGLAGCFLPELQAGAAFLAAVLIGQVGFGVYVMIAERRWTRSGGGRYA